MAAVTEPLAYRNGRFVPFSEATVSVADLSVVQGVTLTETLRTFGGRLRLADEHAARMRRGAERLGFELPTIDELASVFAETAERNRGQGWPDTLVTAVASPGLSRVHSLGREAGPTLIVHVRPAPLAAYADLYRRGWHLRSHVRMHADPAAFPRDIKHRSRLNWYLAQQRQGAEPRPADAPFLEPLFVDADGVVTETNTGNVVTLSGRTLTLAPADRVLPGVTQALIREVCCGRGFRLEERPQTLDEVCGADEIMLTSGGYVLGPVTAIDGREVGGGEPGCVWRSIAAAAGDRLGCDFVRQASGAGER